MHVLKVVQFYFPFQDRGGPVFKVRALARHLGKRGHNVTVLTADLGLEKYDHIDSSFEPCKWGWRTASDGIETIYLSTVARYRALTVNPHVLGYARTCLKRFDLVHCYGLYDLFGPTVSYFCRQAGIPYIVEPVGMYRPIDRSLRVKRLWHRALGATFLNNAARIVTTSEIEQQELMDDGVSKERLVVRYNGIDNEVLSAPPTRGSFRRQWGISPDEPVILFLSRLIPRKNAGMLIAAFATACPANGRLIIAGPEGLDGYRSSLEKLALECGVRSRVIFTGGLYGDGKLAAMCDADIFVLPSRYENFANAPAEAVACGVPVIVSDKCGISALIGGRAGLVVRPELDSLVVALRTLLNDPVLYYNYKNGCRTVAAELSWDRLTQQMEACYRQVLTSDSENH
jgi:glycosyltransferase involved in cell wall biosynthesis